MREKHQTPELRDLVQEITDRGGWVSNNSIVFLITGTGTRVAESYNGESNNAPLLHVKYVLNGVRSVTPPAIANRLMEEGY
ncbi:MAG: hypothetical protein DRI84_05580 [Bacteroidetes bacterium]|nr:MAG: hypothetical protein DRI84_05580 [Bacteroidota bacterium]